MSKIIQLFKIDIIGQHKDDDCIESLGSFMVSDLKLELIESKFKDYLNQFDNHTVRKYIKIFAVESITKLCLSIGFVDYDLEIYHEVMKDLQGDSDDFYYDIDNIDEDSLDIEDIVFVDCVESMEHFVYCELLNIDTDEYFDMLDDFMRIRLERKRRND